MTSKPLPLSQILLRAKAHVKKGELDQARQLYQSVLKKYPENKKAIEGLKSLPDSMPQPGSAELKDKINELIGIYSLGRFQEVLDQGLYLSQRYPKVPLVLNLMGAAYLALGRNEEAAASHRRALEISPDRPETHNYLGIALNKLGRHEEAVARYQRALELKPHYAEALQNLGAALSYLGKNEQAVVCYNNALRINPDNVIALVNLGMVLNNLNRLEEAVINFRRALKAKPDDISLLCKLGKALTNLGEHEEAIASYQRVVSVDKDNITARGALLYLFILICDWDQISAGLPDDIKLLEHGYATKSTEMPGPFGLLGLIDDAGFHRRMAEAYAAANYMPNTALGPVMKAYSTGRIRIGYFSADFHDHATMYLMAELFERHDRERFEVHAFSFGLDIRDAMRSRLMGAVEYFHDVRLKGNAEIAGLSRSLGIDIAVDLKGYTGHSRAGIFAFRAAPVQVNYLGYPGTLGSPNYDYIIADPTLIPDTHRKYYTEKVAYLPDCYQVNDSTRKISDLLVSRSDFGLPVTGFVFCCFNHNYKIMPDVFTIWMRLLDRLDGSVLWLLKGNEMAERNLRKEALRRGIGPERLVFAERVPLPEHLARHRLADLFLDTFNYNAHTTASDALWACLPVLTKLGEGFASRVAGSLLTAVGLPEMIMTTAQAYEDKALMLATHPEELQALKVKLEGNLKTTALFNAALFTSHIESAYSQMYKRLNDGLVPERIHVRA